MTATLAHRGPDDYGHWVSPDAGVAVGFRRLAIIDLSEHGHQPMHSASGRFTIVFNGEVFNFRRLRAELENTGARFRGHSDTEVILAAFERWGIESATQRFVGMFAIAVWDVQERTLSLIRDRMGIKPLFVYAKDGLVTFGSELKALVAGPAFDRTLDTGAVSDFLRYLYVPAPRTIYAHALKLEPGHILTISDAAAPLPRARPYWSIQDACERGLANPFVGDDREAVDELDRRLSDAVRLRMEADVPLGALLSGGIDSSTVVALLQEMSPRPVRTYSVAFDIQEHNEADHAARVAAHLGTDHTEVMLTGHDALAIVPRLAEIFDEPHADTAQIPALLICGVARRDVTVALSGDGGDEVFGGYNRYTYGERMLQRAGRVPAPARAAVAAGIGSLSAHSWNRMHRAVSPMLPSTFRHRLPGEKLHKLGRLLRAESLPRMYRALVAVWPEHERLVLGDSSRTDLIDRILARKRPARLVERMMLADQLAYLPDDQLAKVDRVSMAVSLEVRVPLLDHRVVEFAWQLPMSMKIRDQVGKWILRQVLYRRVPQALVERPKMGFSVPLGAWLRGPLRDWASDLLSTDRLAREGVLHPELIGSAWREVRAGRDELALGLWAVLMFQAWRERWLT
jgi:asparagine synthase (glutamine-hydrolysing)